MAASATASSALPRSLTYRAAAKINLTLRVCGRRDDGYHRLVSLVAFTDIADDLHISLEPHHDPLAAPKLAISGPFAATLNAAAAADPNNLILAAAQLMRRNPDEAQPRFRLIKRLPIAAGLGGGSADAAATLHILNKLTGIAIPSSERLAALGADIPACLHARAGIMRGIGEIYQPLASFPPCWIVLAHCRRSLATADVFRTLTLAHNNDEPPLPPPFPASVIGLDNMISWLRSQGNDLEAPARRLIPEIGDALAALQQTPNVLHVAMSGSGASCYGLYRHANAAAAARQQILKAQQKWWTAWGPVF